MAQTVYYQTLNNLGVDPTIYYLPTFTAGASITPEYPSAPFIPGQRAFGSDNSEFIFVQASTAINLTDFVAIYAGTAAAPFQAGSISTINLNNAGFVGIGSTGLVLRQSVTTIPAGAFFWACTRGTFLPATTSGLGTTGLGGQLATAGANVALFCALSGVGTGIITSVSSSSSPAFAGIICINSLTLSTGIAASVVPPAGTLSATGLTLGPVVNLNNPRLVTAYSSTGAQISAVGAA